MASLPLVLIVDDIHPALKDGLEAMGYVCEDLQGITKDAFMNALPGAIGVAIRSRFRLDREVLSNAPDLRFIARAGSGMENIDVEYARAKGVFCVNAPEGNKISVGEHATGLLLAVFHRICKGHSEVSRGVWNRDANWGMEVMGKSIGIIGYGNTGSAFARCLSGFGMDVMGYDKYKSGFGNQFVREVDMDEVFATADVVSFHVPLTAETRGLFCRDYLSRFEKPIVLINTARGGVVQTSHLVEGLVSGRITGAGLDVLEYEKSTFEALDFESLPEEFRFLASHPNVVLTPHVAGWSPESYQRLSTVLLEKIQDAFHR